MIKVFSSTRVERERFFIALMLDCQVTGAKALRKLWRLVYIVIIALVVVILWAFTIQGFLPEELRQAYLTYFNIVRAITTVMLGILIIELVASLITVRLKHLGRGST